MIEPCLKVAVSFCNNVCTFMWLTHLKHMTSKPLKWPTNVHILNNALLFCLSFKIFSFVNGVSVHRGHWEATLCLSSMSDFFVLIGFLKHTQRWLCLWLFVLFVNNKMLMHVRFRLRGSFSVPFRNIRQSIFNKKTNAILLSLFICLSLLCLKFQLEKKE